MKIILEGICVFRWGADLLQTLHPISILCPGAVLWASRECAHLDAHMGVVGVSSGPQVLASSLGSQEVAQEFGAVLEVVTTHTPLPGLPAFQAGGVITGTALHAPSTAGPGQRMGEGSCRHCIQEGCLLETCARHQNASGEKEALQRLSEDRRGASHTMALKPKYTSGVNLAVRA